MCTLPKRVWANLAESGSRSSSISSFSSFSPFLPFSPFSSFSSFSPFSAFSPFSSCVEDTPALKNLLFWWERSSLVRLICKNYKKNFEKWRGIIRVPLMVCLNLDKINTKSVICKKSTVLFLRGGNCFQRLENKRNIIKHSLSTMKTLKSCQINFLNLAVHCPLSFSSPPTPTSNQPLRLGVVCSLSHGPYK